MGEEKAMRVGAVLIGALIAALSVTSATATVRIAGDLGGQIGHYLDRYASIRSSGQKVVIDGSCVSACTLVLGSVPSDRICITSRAKLGFHAAWRPTGKTGQVTDAEATKLLMDNYPAPVRNWISQRGGLTPRMIYLSGSELAAMYQPCK
jgi:hypothetical protein